MVHGNPRKLAIAYEGLGELAVEDCAFVLPGSCLHLY
jgi:hypothetical protein